MAKRRSPTRTSNCQRCGTGLGSGAIPVRTTEASRPSRATAKVVRRVCMSGKG